MSIASQARHLVDLKIPALAGLTPDEFLADVNPVLAESDGGLLAIHPDCIPASALVPLLVRAGKPGFVVTDMTDLDEFTPIDGIDIPGSPIYVVHGVDRGDDMSNWSPDEALPEVTARGRTPLTASEGISWLLQEPERLEPNRCFMTIGSRKRKGQTLDTRTPAIWISGGTGRDGAGNRGAPKVGWCWAGNRHTWLGFASAAGRSTLG